MPILTPQEMRLATAGVSLKRMSDAELAQYIEDASQLAATYCNQDTLEFRQVEEIKLWNGESLRFHLMQAPIRTLMHYSLLLGAVGGSDISISLDDTPAPLTGSPTILPTTVGAIKIIRTVNGGDASAYLLAVSGSGIGGFMQIEQVITYTAGFDDGAVQADGYSVPYPGWLKTAVRFIVIDLLGEWETGRRGMTGLQQLRIADAVFRKPTSRSRDEVVIPLKAQRILDRHFRPWLGG